MESCTTSSHGAAGRGLRCGIRLVPLFLLAGCGVPDLGLSTGGGSPAAEGDGLGGVIGLATGSYLVLDLGSGKVTSLTQAATDSTDYRSSKMLFRRVKGQGVDYFVGVFEITQAQWGLIAGAGSTPWNNLAPLPIWQAAAVAPDKPAFNLSYAVVDNAITAYNSSHGTTLGLPNDGEWTFACAAGSNGTWSWGTVTGAPAVLAGRAVVRESQLGVVGPRAVGGTAANGLGFFDMHGNVFEWCFDASAAPGARQPFRGGSWFNCPVCAKCDSRSMGDPTTREATLGFRVVRTPD